MDVAVRVTRVGVEENAVGPAVVARSADAAEDPRQGRGTPPLASSSSVRGRLKWLTPIPENRRVRESDESTAVACQGWRSRRRVSDDADHLEDEPEGDRTASSSLRTGVLASR